MKSLKSLKKIMAVGMILMLVFSLVACKGKKVPVTTEDPDYTSTVTENTLRFHADGSITEIAVEDFAEATASQAEIEGFVQSEVDSFNQTKGLTAVELLEFKMEGTVAKCALKFQDINVYNEFDHIDVTLSLFNREEADTLTRAEIASATEAALAASKAANSVDTATVSDEELAEAGFSAEDVENGNLETEAQQQVDDLTSASATDAVATFTDAKGNTDIKSDDITDDSLMMVMTGAPFVLEFEDGACQYYNHHAVLNGNGSVTTDGQGNAIVVFSFNY